MTVRVYYGYAELTPLRPPPAPISYPLSEETCQKLGMSEWVYPKPAPLFSCLPLATKGNLS